MNRKAFKGISPIVAVVILIGISITVGTIVSIWVTSWVTTQTESKTVSCITKTTYVIESAEFNGSGDNLLIVKVTNKGDQGIYKLGAILDNETMIMVFNHTSGNISVSPSISSSHPLEEEESVYMKINLTAGGESNETIQSWFYRGFLTTLSKVKVTNEACDSVSATTTSVIQGT